MMRREAHHHDEECREQFRRDHGQEVPRAYWLCTCDPDKLNAEIDRLRAENETGAGRIAKERRRQVSAEGWTLEHDKQYEFGQLVNAAVCYALSDPAGWPWDMRWWKPSDDTVRNLEKAGALIAAEIDRLLALELASAS